MSLNWRLGIDLGTNSLGWWAYKIEKQNSKWVITDSLAGGVYIFPDGREPSTGGRIGDSNAVRRRLARSMRRNRDRRKTRLRAYLRELENLGLMPSSAEERKQLFQTPEGANHDLYNPYFLRAKATQTAVEPYELGRALFHLGLRRGFKSSRIETNADEDGGKLKERIDQLSTTLNGLTLGQFLWNCYQSEGRNQPAGIRFRGENEFYPNRSMYEEEFNKIIEVQSPHYKDIKEEDWCRLRDRYVLFQHPLKTVKRGPCQFFPDKPRHWQDTPIGHDFRIYQELANLRWIDIDKREHPLDVEQRDMVLNLLHTRKSKIVKFDSMRKQKKPDGSLYFSKECIRFNLEDEKRKGLKNHGVGVRLSESETLSHFWNARCSDSGDGGQLDDIFEILHETQDDEELRITLIEKFNLNESSIEELFQLPLTRTTGHVSRKFMENIVPVMRDQGLPYVDAVQELKDDQGNPLHHSKKSTEPSRDKLPYYGEVIAGLVGADGESDPIEKPEKHFGKINNPTVHVALNSLRRVVNTLIERFGRCPTEIHIELARELKQPRQLCDRITREQADRQKENEKIRTRLENHGIASPSAQDVKKVRLWEELGKDELLRRCPFSGQTISFSQLLNGEAEIEHILPFKRTLDDSMSNLTVAMRWANRLKGNQTPYEAFATDAHSNKGIKWDTICELATRLPKNKEWRFGPNAMDRFEGENDFLARQLTDNAYIAKTAKDYLSCLKGIESIVPSRGGLTALLRGRWGLNGILSEDSSKNREDHRHHAVDAAVVGLTTRAVLRDVSHDSARDVESLLKIRVPELPEEIASSIRSTTQAMTVAFKSDHGWQGRMYAETAYGFVGRPSPHLPDHNLVTRKPLRDLSFKELGQIRNTRIREDIERLGIDKETSVKERQALLDEYSKKTGTRKVRILIINQMAKPIPTAAYKRYAPDSYVCCDIWRCPKKAKGQYKWEGVFWAYRDTPNGVPAADKCKPHPGAKFICRLFKNDMITYENDGVALVKRVAGFSTTNNRIDIVPHTAAKPKRNYVSINVLGEKGLRKLYVSPDGRIR